MLACLLLIGLQPGMAQGQDEAHNLKGDKYYKAGETGSALAQYQAALGINPNNLKANYMAGLCYLQASPRERALNYFQQAYDIDPNYTVFGLNMPSSLLPELMYLCGYAYQLAENMPQAEDYYRFLKKEILRKPTEDPAEIDRRNRKLALIDRRMYECAIARELMAAPVEVKKLCPDSLNSRSSDLAPVYSPANRVLYFTSRRQPFAEHVAENAPENKAEAKANTKPENRPVKTSLDIYAAGLKTDTSLYGPESVEELNTDQDETCLSISADGETMLILKPENGGDIYVSHLKNKEWSRPKALSEINSRYHESGASFSPDGKTMYISSNRPGGQGGQDIWQSSLLGPDRWSLPKNMGLRINTPYDEDCPATTRNGKGLFFSSMGHRGMGGYDIFRTDFMPDSLSWTLPANMSYPLNTTDHDLWFSPGPDSLSAWYSAVKEGCAGAQDIYLLIFPGGARAFSTVQDSAARAGMASARMKQRLTEINNSLAVHHETSEEDVIHQETRKTGPVTISISVTEAGSGKLLPAMLSFTNRKTGKKFPAKRIAEGTYQGIFSFAKKTDMLLSVSADGYNFRNIAINLPGTTERAEKEIERTVELEPIALNRRLMLRNVYFDLASAKLKPESEPELEILLNFLQANTGIIMEIAGHSDISGNVLRNLELSRQRAASVVAWLNARGIEPGRLRPKGYGQTRPLASNDDEAEGRELNRRTEFVILGRHAK
ncbi:MAG: OmpA family protein [Bacteroidota bacterium]